MTAKILRKALPIQRGFEKMTIKLEQVMEAIEMSDDFLQVFGILKPERLLHIRNKRNTRLLFALPYFAASRKPQKTPLQLRNATTAALFLPFRGDHWSSANLPQQRIFWDSFLTRQTGAGEQCSPLQEFFDSLKFCTDWLKTLVRNQVQAS